MRQGVTEVGDRRRPVRRLVGSGMEVALAALTLGLFTWLRVVGGLTALVLPAHMWAAGRGGRWRRVVWSVLGGISLGTGLAVLGVQGGMAPKGMLTTTVFAGGVVIGVALVLRAAALRRR